MFLHRHHSHFAAWRRRRRRMAGVIKLLEKGTALGIKIYRPTVEATLHIRFSHFAFKEVNIVYM